MKLNSQRWGFVFDFDGVIANTIVALYDIYLSFLREHDCTGSKNEFDYLNGPKLEDIIKHLKVTHQLKPTLADLESDYRARLKTLYQHASPNADIHELLKNIKSQNFPLLIASSCSRGEIITFLKKYSLFDFFDHIISGDEVNTAKPAPDIYLKAKELYPKHNLVVIEDSSNGLKAANAAGLFTVHYSPSDVTNDPQAAFHITGFNKLLSLLEATLSDTIAISRAADQLTIKHTGKHDLGSDTLKLRIDSLWQAEANTNGLFDSNILCYKGHTFEGGLVSIDTTDIPYRYYYAQKKGINLPWLLQPLAVSGLIVDSNDRTLIGKRNNVTDHCDQWELVPSGGINTEHIEEGEVDWTAQIVEEFLEETEMKKSDIRSIFPLGLFYCTSSFVFDIGSIIRLNKAIQNEDTMYNSEYSAYKVQPFNQNLTQISGLIPTSQALINVALCKF